MRPLETGDPHSIGPFTVLARLGSGAMGAVYLARSRGGRPVAVKLVHAHLAHDEPFRARFRREVGAARRVGGFWTAAVVDADPDADRPWLATEYVAGPTLQDAVSDAGPLPEPAVRTMAAGIAEALMEIHRTGLVHRDVKPSNVLLSADGPRLIDFGIARAQDHSSLTMAGTMLGTAGYAAPEQISGGTVGPASDVFALGAVLVFAATGRGPFGAGTRTELLLRATAGPPHIDGTPPWLRPLAEACLATDPRSRPTLSDVVTVAGPLAGLADGGWLPAPVRTMVATQAAALPATIVDPDVAAASGRRKPAAPTPAAAGPGAGPAYHDAGTAGAVFEAPGIWAALRAGLCLLGILVSGSLSGGQPIERLLGAILFVTSAAAAIAVLVGVVGRGRRLEIGRDGIVVLRRRRQFRLQWAQISRIGVADERDPWLVLWPASPVTHQLLRGSFRAHHGGYRIFRVAPWRRRRRRDREVREVRAALAWYARTRVDPHL